MEASDAVDGQRQGYASKLRPDALKRPWHNNLLFVSIFIHLIFRVIFQYIDLIEDLGPSNASLKTTPNTYLGFLYNLNDTCCC